MITDDVAMAEQIAAHASPTSTLIKIHNFDADGDDLLALAAALGSCLAGAVTHDGHS